MIEVSHVSKVYKKRTVVDDVTVNFEEGQITGIVGRNGSGKTVLFRMICGLTIPTKGEITVNGERIGQDVDFPGSLGAIIEVPGFIGMESGYKNLWNLAKLRKRIGKDDVRKAMETVGLDPDEKKAVRKYSLGMRQRLGIAQAMNGLDNDGAKEMRALICSLRDRGKTIVLASHNMYDISEMCDKVYYMDKGCLSESEG